MADPALEDCDKPCVPQFIKNDKNDVVKECPEQLWSEALCFREREQDKSMYAAVDWSTLATTIKGYFDRFLESVMEDEELGEQIVKAYTYGPFPPESKWNAMGGRPATWAFLESKLVKNPDYDKCDNITIRIVLNRGPVKGRQKQEIAHISLHPERPKYIREELRSRSGCGYFPKRTNANRNARPEDISPFMYTVETIEWRGKEIRDDNPNRVNLPLFADPDAPGMFLPLGARRFEKLFTAGFTNGRAEEKLPIDPEQLARVNAVHTAIYSKFVTFWNTKMLEGIAGNSLDPATAALTALPSIRKSALGGKRTRKQKQKHKRRRKTYRRS